MLEIHIGNVWSRVVKAKATAEELEAVSKLIRVRQKGYIFSRAWKMGRWDGYKNFFNRGTGTFYTGLLGYIKDNLPELEIHEIDERAKPEMLHSPVMSDCEGFLQGIKLYDFQFKAVLLALQKGRGIIASPVNSGKTVMAAAIIKHLGMEANFVTHRITLLYQTREAFQNMLGIKVGILGDMEEEIEDVNILSVVTLAKRLDDFKALLKLTPVIFSDECHHVSAKGWTDILKASGAYYRFGLSATPLLRDDISNLTVRGLTGDEIITVTENEMVEAGISARSSVYLYEVEKPKFKSHTRFADIYDQSIVFSEYRNGLVRDFAKMFLDQGKSVMIVVWRLDHGEYLEKMFKEAGIQAEYIKGGSGEVTHTRTVLKLFGERKVMCVIATSIIDEGLNIPAMDVMINAVGDKSPLKTTQRPGRGKRKKTFGENVLTIVDFMDFNEKKHLEKHSLSRMKVYAGMGVPIYEVKDREWKEVVKI
jgi:superfamily II DNA or RNA helicase